MSDEMTTRMPDEIRMKALMVSYQAGHLGAFEELYTLLVPVVRRYLIGRARDAARAEDLVQETFLQVHRARHTFDPAYPLVPWAIAIARHVWLMHRRTQSRRPQASESVEVANLPVRADADRLADRLEVRQALSGVNESRRRPVIMHHVLGLSFKEIGARLGIGEAAAKLRSSRGMAQLRERLTKNREAERRDV